MISSSLAPVIVPHDGFAALPLACEHLHNELNTKIFAFACGASQEVKNRLLEMQSLGKVELLDLDFNELLTPVEMRNLASARLTQDYILYLDPNIKVTQRGIDCLLQSLHENNADFASPLLLRQNRVLFGGYQLRSTHRANGELARLKMFDRYADLPSDGVPAGICTSDSVHFHCFVARTSTLHEVFRGWDERMSGLEAFDFALRARFHKLKVLVNADVRFELETKSNFDTFDRMYRAFCSAESFRMLARDAFEFKWSAAAPSDTRWPRTRKRDVFLRRSLQHRIDNALTRIARYQSPEPKSQWRELLLG